jgi:hypothetical protein
MQNVYIPERHVNTCTAFSIIYCTYWLYILYFFFFFQAPYNTLTYSLVDSLTTGSVLTREYFDINPSAGWIYVKKSLTLTPTNTFVVTTFISKTLILNMFKCTVNLIFEGWMCVGHFVFMIHVLLIDSWK